jgi:hypothetical protein
MASPYILENLKEIKRPAQDRVILFAFIFNIEGCNSKIFQVAYSNNLSVYLSKSKIVDWHYKTFKTPIKILVLGSIMKDDASKALKDLELQLKNDGLYYIPDYNDFMKTEMIKRFLKKKGSSDIDWFLWRKRWGVAYKEYRKEVEVKAVGIDKSDIVKFVNSQQQYSTESLNFVLKLASYWNPQSGYAEVIFYDYISTRQWEKLQKSINSARWCWIPVGKIQKFSINRFKLSKPTLSKI